MQGADGYFYGTTNLGGLYNLGTVFRVSASGIFQSLENKQASRLFLQQRHGVESDLSNECECAFTTDEKILHRIASHILHAFVSQCGQGAIWQHDR